MKKACGLILLTVCTAILLCACGCEHEWVDANCTTPKTCKLCNKTEGNILAHAWEDATCTAPKTCSGCGLTEGDSLGHNWQEATCTDPKTCAACNATDGDALGHTESNWKTSKESTCSEAGTETTECAVCGQTLTREKELLAHTAGDWEITTKATPKKAGEETLLCANCGASMDTRSYTTPPFDVTPLQNKRNFSYDSFSKSWKYFSYYEKQYSDATVRVSLIMFSEDNGSNLEEMEIRASMVWKDAAAAKVDIDSLEILVNDKIYSFEMKIPTDSNYSYSFLISDTSYEFIKDLANANSLKMKVHMKTYGSHEYDLPNNPYKSFCEDIIKYNIWDYYAPEGTFESIMRIGDSTTVR